MAVLLASISAGRFGDTPNDPGLVSMMNAVLAPLLSNDLNGVAFDAQDNSRYSGFELTLTVSYATGGTTITNPFKVIGFTGASLADTTANAQAFIDANPTYFVSPLFTRLVRTARSRTAIVGVVFYNESSSDGSANWKVNGAGSGGGGTPTGPAGGDLGGTFPNPSVVTVGGATAANVATGATAANAATNANTASTIVKRDSSGNFSAGTITAALAGNATSATTAGHATTADSATTAGHATTADTATDFTGDLAGDVSGSQTATVIGPNVVSNAKLAQAPAMTIKGNPTSGFANEQDVDMPTLGPIVSPFIVAPMSTRSISKTWSAFTPNDIFEYTKNGVVKIAAGGTGGLYAICDIASGTWINGAIAGFGAKTICGGWYNAVTDRIILMTTEAAIYEINPNNTPWTASAALLTNINPPSLVPLTGHNEFLVCTNGQFLKRYDATTSPPTLIATYDPTGGGGGIVSLGYDAVNDNVYAAVGNVGIGGVMGRVYKVPRPSFASNTLGQSLTDQNPPSSATPLTQFSVAGGFLWATSIGGAVGILWSTATLAPTRSFGIIGNQPSKFVAHPTNGFLYGIGGAGLVTFVKIDPTVNGYRAMRPVDVVSGINPVSKDILAGTDGFLYALIFHGSGSDIYQINQ